jgi:DNA-repair protein complementing XP-A cells
MHVAKAKQREREEQHASSSSAPNANNKRTLNSVVPADSHSATAPLKRDSRLGKYFDYDLSKMANSKGGFLVDDGKEIDDQRRAKELQRERERAKQSLEPGASLRLYFRPESFQLISSLPAIHVQLDKNPKCRECESIDLDQTYLKVLGCMVCHKCKNELPEKYSLLTKTECKTVCHCLSLFILCANIT